MVVGSPTKLNLIPSGVMPVVYINQGDAGYDKEFLIYNGDSPYNVPAGVSATIRGTKADGYGVTEAAEVTTGSNLVTVTITEQMVAAAGENLYELVFVDTNDLRVASINMVWAVKCDALGDSVISDSDLDYATQVMNELQSVQAFKNQLDTNTEGLAAETAARIVADDTERAARISADATLQENINAEASARLNKDNLLQSQIDQLVAPTGSAPSAAEIQDARIGADGVTYNTLGNAIRGQITDLKKEYNTLGTDYPLALGTWENGAFVSWNKRMTNRNMIPVKAGDVIKYQSPTLPLYIAIHPESDITKEVQVRSWHTAVDVLEYQCAYDGGIIFLFRNGDGSGTIALSDYDADIKIYNTQHGRLVTHIDSIQEQVGSKEIATGEWEQGSINGIGDLINDTLRIRTAGFLPMPPVLNVRIDENKPAKKFNIKQYNEIGGFVSDSGWKTDSTNFERPETATQFKITLAYTNDTTIVPSAGSAIYAQEVVTEGLTEQVMNLEIAVNKNYNYFYSGERFDPRVGGFISAKYLTMSYSGSMTLNDIAIYGNYLLACINPGTIFVYNFTTKEKLAELSVTKSGVQQNEHFANVEFSNAFYNANDLFPLLYCHSDTGTYHVVRISDLSTAEVVKTYVFSAQSGTSPMIAFNFKDGIGYGLNSFEIDDTTEYKLVKYDLSNEIDNGDGTYTFPIISVGTCPDLRVRQGMKYYNGRIYMLTTRATSSPFDPELIALDCNEENALITMRAQTLPFTSEGEGLAVSVEDNTAYIYITDYFNVYKLAF